MDITSLAQEYQLWFIIGAVVCLGMVFLVRGINKRNKTILSVIGVVCVAMLILGYVGPITGGNGGGGGEEEESPIEWIVTLTTTYPGAADADEEMLDTQMYVACDGGTPDLDATMATFGTNAQTDYLNNRVTYQSDMDNDVPPGGLMQELECLTVAWTISLKQGIDANGDGTMDAIQHGFKLLSIGPATFSDWNRSTPMNTVYFDAEAGWEVAGYASGAEWYSAFDNAGKFASTMPSSGPWVLTDSHAGGGAAADTGVFAIVLNTPNGAPAGYASPTSVGGVCFSYKIAVGSPEDYTVVTGEWVLLTRD